MKKISIDETKLPAVMEIIENMPFTVEILEGEPVL